MNITEGLYEYLEKHPPDYGDADSILGMLYCRYNECNTLDTAEIKADFEMLYLQMNGMPLREMDGIVDTVCVRTPPGKCVLTAGRCACVPAELCTHSA